MTQTTGTKRLYKSRTERMIDGVCGGLAQYFGIDPTLVRIAWVLLTLLGGSGIILYIAAMIIIPKEPFPGVPPSPGKPTGSKKNSTFWGLLLIVGGVFLFVENMGWTFWKPWWWFNADILLPVILILVGVAFLWGGRNALSTTPAEAQHAGQESSPPPSEATPRSEHRVHRSVSDRKLFGVCGGIAEYFEIDSTIIRILFIVSAVMSFGVALVAYVVLAILLPKEQPRWNMS